MRESEESRRRKRPKSDVFLNDEEKAQIETVIGGDFGERFSGGFAAKQIAEYYSVEGDGSLRYDGEIQNLKIQNSAMNEPTRLFGNWQRVAKKKYGLDHNGDIDVNFY